MRDARTAIGIGQWAVIGAAAGPLGVEILPIDISTRGDVATAMSEFARGSNDGLIVGVGTAATVQRDAVIALAAQRKLPTVYSYRFFVEAGGLISYRPSLVDLYRRAAGYVDRILRGEKAGGPAGASADQVYAGGQPQDRQGPRPNGAAFHPRPRRRGDRVKLTCWEECK